MAFVIAAMALGALYTSVESGLAAAETGARTEEALARARTHLALTGGGAGPGDQEGDEDGFHWHVRIRPKETAWTAGGTAIVLYAVTVSVSWRAGRGTRRVHLDAERIGLAPAS